MRFDTAALLEQIKAIAMVPDSQALLSDDRILRFANAQKNLLVQLIQSVVEEYFVYTEDYTVDSSTQYITIPESASGMRLRDVYYLDQANGKITYQVPRRQLDQLGQNSTFFVPTGERIGSYYLENDKIKFWPALSETKYIRVFYYRMPNELVTVDSGIQVGECNISNGFESSSLTPVPSTWATNLSNQNQFDVISSRSPYNTKGTITVNGISDSVFYVNDPEEQALIEPGDYIYLKGEAPVIQYMPQEAFYVLASAAATYVLKSVGDSVGLKECQMQFELERANLLKLVSPRSVGQPKKLINRNSIFKSARLGWSTIVR